MDDGNKVGYTVGVLDGFRDSVGVVVGSDVKDGQQQVLWKI